MLDPYVGQRAPVSRSKTHLFVQPLTNSTAHPEDIHDSAYESTNANSLPLLEK